MVADTTWLESKLVRQYEVECCNWEIPDQSSIKEAMILMKRKKNKQRICLKVTLMASATLQWAMNWRPRFVILMVEMIADLKE